MAWHDVLKAGLLDVFGVRPPSDGTDERWLAELEREAEELRVRADAVARLADLRAGERPDG